MRRILRCLLVLPLLPLGVVLAEWKEKGKTVPDKAWARFSGDFGAQLVLTDHPDELLEAWEKPGPAALQGGISIVPRGTQVVAVVFVVGCASDPRGSCQSGVRFTATGPDGKPWGDPQDADLWSNKRPPGKGLMQLGLGTMEILLDPDDALGVYKVKAEVVDKVKKRTLVLERSFTAVEGEEDEEEPDDAEGS